MQLRAVHLKILQLRAVHLTRMEFESGDVDLTSKQNSFMLCLVSFLSILQVFFVFGDLQKAKRVPISCTRCVYLLCASNLKPCDASHAAGLEGPIISYE